MSVAPTKNASLISQKTVSEKVKLERTIGLLSGTSVLIGVMIGSGIFVSPKGILKYTGSPMLSLVLWLISGAYTMLGALSYAELGIMIPKSGGDYAYIYESFGSMTAFLYLWISIIILYPTLNAVLALIFAEYTLKPFFPECPVPYTSILLLATCLICILSFINCYSVKWATKTQDLSTIGKVGALFVIVISALVYVIIGKPTNLRLDKLMEGSRYDVPSIALAFYSGVFSFAGWNNLNFLTEEIKNPKRNLTLAIYIGVIATTIIYVLVNLAYFAVLSAVEILDSNAVAILFAQKVLGPIAFLMPAFVACSCVGCLNGMIMTVARLYFAGARDGQLPELLAMISPALSTPSPSVIFLGIVTIVFLAFDIDVLINSYAFAQSLIYAVAVLGLIKLRWQHPEIERPVKFHIWIPIVFLVFTVLILILPFLVSPFELIASAVVIASGVPVYFLFIYPKQKPEIFYRRWVAFTHAIQKLLLTVAEEE